MKRKLKFGLILMLVLSMVFCFVGCNQKDDDDDDDRPRRTRASKTVEDEDNTTADRNSNNDNDRNDNQSSNISQGITGIPGASSSKHSAELSIITIGDDKLVISITGNACEGVAPKDRYEDGTDHFEISGDVDNLQISCYSAYAYFYQDNRDYYNTEYRKGITANAGGYLIEIDKEGICSDFDFGKNLTLYLSTSSEYIELGNYKTSSVVTKGTDEDAKLVLAEIQKNAVAKNPAKASWAGIYINEAYSDVVAFAEVEITDNGMIHIHASFDGVEKDYYLEEEDYDTATYDYGTFEHATAKDYSVGNNVNSSFTYYYDYGNRRLQYDYSDYSNYEDNMYVTLKPFYGGYHIAPDDYDDSDRYGYMKESYPQDKKYMVPKTDDYIMRVQKTSAWNGDDSLSCVLTSLSSVDVNGHICARVDRYVFDTNADAASVYAFYSSQGYSTYEYVLDGNVMYSTVIDYEYLVSDTKSDYSYRPSDFYVNCNYLYYYDDAEYFDYAYYSKPFTEDDFSMSLEDILFWNSIEDGEHACTDTQDVSMNVHVNENDTYFYVYDYSSNSTDACMISNFGYTKMNGRSAVAIQYNTWDNYIFVKELEADETVCIITEYRFSVDDWDNIPVTFDNYKKMKADNVITHKFDMTRVKSY